MRLSKDTDRMSPGALSHVTMAHFNQVITQANQYIRGANNFMHTPENATEKNSFNYDFVLLLLHFDADLFPFSGLMAMSSLRLRVVSSLSRCKNKSIRHRGHF